MVDDVVQDDVQYTLECSVITGDKFSMVDAGTLRAVGRENKMSGALSIGEELDILRSYSNLVSYVGRVVLLAKIGVLRSGLHNSLCFTRTTSLSRTYYYYLLKIEVGTFPTITDQTCRAFSSE